MTHTTAGEDAACERIRQDASALVEALNRLDDTISDKNREIDRLNTRIEELEEALEGVGE